MLWPYAFFQAALSKERDKPIEIELCLLQVFKSALLSVPVEIGLDLEFVSADQFIHCKLGLGDLDRLEWVVCSAVVRGMIDLVEMRKGRLEGKLCELLERNRLTFGFFHCLFLPSWTRENICIEMVSTRPSQNKL